MPKIFKNLISLFIIFVLLFTQVLTPTIILAQEETSIASPEPTATPTVVQSVEQGEISASIVENVDLSGILTTDKADYAPVDIVLITGTGFTASQTYTLEISSTDEPPVTFSNSVTTDSQGSFFYAYQLDGNYRPNYFVVVKTLSGEEVAQTSFTDAPTGTITIGDVTVFEGDSGTTNASFSVTLARTGNGTIGVDYSAADVSATGGATCTGSTDYLNTSGTITWTGSTAGSQTVTVSVCGDINVESNETFNVNLTVDQGSPSITDSQGVGTIRNDDSTPTATLTLVKVLPNDNGGDATEDDFAVYINAVESTWGEHELDAGSYTISEDTLLGYEPGAWDGDCNPDGTITLIADEEYTCTITNDDIAPTLTLIKDPTNDNGGTAEPDDFLLTIGGNPAVSGVSMELDANTAYAIDETVLVGYEFVEITGDVKCPAVLGGKITLDEGEDIICTIVNDDIPGEIHGMKFEDINGNGVMDGVDSGLAGWTIFLDENGDDILDGGEVSTVTSGNGGYEFTDLSVGIYKVREVQQEGWVQTTSNPADIPVTLDSDTTGVDFGNFELYTITGKKYYDTTTSLGIAGWPIFADYNGNGLLDGDESDTLTEIDGTYTLLVGPGSPNICEIRGGWMQTLPVSGADCGVNGFGYPVTPTSGGLIDDQNFGNKLQVLPPISLTKKEFQKGSTIPVKFPSPTGELLATLVICPISVAPPGAPCTNANSSGGANHLNQFRYDSGQYIFNLSTKMPIFVKPNTYGLWVTLGDIGPVLLETITIK